MLNRKWGVAIGGMLVMLAGLAVPPLPAQEPSAPKAEEATKPKAGTASVPMLRRVPPNFGQVGLSTEQREEIYRIRGRHQVIFAELRAQMDAAVAKEMAECEATLSESQLKLLEQRRAVSKAKSKARTKPAEPPASKPEGGD
jgi:hypothetical protein